MVRFIINRRSKTTIMNNIFTFQYGQIYYFLNAHWGISPSNDLHSNMVRFIIYHTGELPRYVASFTFQYGQIYYQKAKTHNTK